MATDICTKRLTKELRNLMKNPITNPKVTVAAKEDNICEVHYVLEVPETEKSLPYAGGIYHGILSFPKNYPLRPPGVKMMTKNGRFVTNRRLCLSMSDFHPESWNPMWSVGTILTGLYSFMIETSPTTGSVETSKRQKELYAKQSLEYNIQDPTFVKLFPQYVELYKEREARKKEEAAAAGKSDDPNNPTTTIAIGQGRRRNGDGDEIDGFFATVAGLIAVFSIILAMRFM